jgi:hypothetical protein
MMVKNLSPNSRVVFYLLKKLEEKGILSDKDVMSIIGDSLK